MVLALQGMFWVLVLTGICIYAFAIVCTRLIGHGIIVSDPEDIDLKARMQFASIGCSMFTLFEIMTGWSLGQLTPLLDAMPWARPMFTIFTMYSSWALMSVMAGTVSENMIAASQAREEDEKYGEESLESRDIE